MKKLLIFTILVSAVTLGGLWSGKKFCAMMSPAATYPGQALYLKIGLDTSQTEAVKKMEASLHREVDALCMQICRERVNLLDQVKGGRISQEAMEKKIEEIGQLQIAIEKKVANHILTVNKNLTPAQSVAYLERIYQQQCQMIAQSGYGEILDKKE